MQADTPNTLNGAETTVMGHRDSADTYLGTGDAKHAVDKTDGIGSHADASNGQTDAQSAHTDAITPADEVGNISTHRNKSKAPNSPAGSATSRSDTTDGFGNRTDMSNARTDVHSIGNNAKTAVNEARTVRTPPNGLKRPDLPVEAANQRLDEPNGCRDHTDASSAQMDAPSVQTGASTPKNGTERVKTRQMESTTRNSPHTHEIATPEPTIRWKRVSVNDTNVYLPQNTPIDRTGRIFIFGRAESAGEAMVARIVDETTGNGVDNRNGGDGDVNGMTSSGNIDSTQVEAALLATDSQQTRSCQITRKYDLPVSFWPPIQPADRPYGPARHKRRRGQLKIKRINDKSVSQTLEVETAHLEHARAAQLPVQSAECPYGPARHRRRRGSLKIERINVSRTPKAETTHLQRAHATRPPEIPSEHSNRVIGPICRRRSLKVERINNKIVSPMRNGETAYLRRDPIAQPRGDDPQRSYRVVGPKRRRGRLKTRPTSVSCKYKERDAHQGPYKPIHLLSLDADDPS